MRLAAAAAALLVAAGCRGAPPVRNPPLPATPASAVPFVWDLPPGLPEPAVPQDNPMSAAKVALGRRLFYDTRLSGNATFACATCHQQRRAFTDGRPRAVGSTGAEHRRGTMSLTNVAYNATLGWADASRRTLEAQMRVPMFNEHPIELGLAGNEPAVLARFSADQDEALFREAFPGETPAVSLEHIVKAIAAFERTLLSGSSPLDRYLYRDDRRAMPVAALRGMRLFFSKRLRCAECHGTFNLSGPVTFAGGKPPAPAFHHTGLYDVDGRGGYPASDRGLVDETGQPADMGRFRAPTLRNVAVTAPYMHDGSVATLRDAIQHYAHGGRPSPLRSREIRGFALAGSDADDLVAFLESLTDERFLANPAFSDPRRAAPAPVPHPAGLAASR